MSSKSTIEVAIVGGGIGGLCLALALLKHSHVRLSIYESSPQFAEIGAGIGFSPNATRALALISPEAQKRCEDFVTYSSWDNLRLQYFEFRQGMAGRQEDELIIAPTNEYGQNNCHRAKLLDVLVKLLPTGLVHFGKRLQTIENYIGGREQVTLRFADGCTARADCVIGADGIHSATRKYILGEGHPAAEPKFSGSVAYRALLPMDMVVSAVGERYAHNSTLWSGTDGFVAVYPIDAHQTVNFIAVRSDIEKPNGQDIEKADLTQLRSAFAEWGKSVKNLLHLLHEKTMKWAIFEISPVEAYWNGRVAMMGDAAHAMTPFVGQGAAQAIEDAFVLGGVFTHVQSPDDVFTAFRAYDRIRRPRAERITKLSRETGELLYQRVPGVKADSDALKESLKYRMDWIWHRDIAAELEEAESVFHHLSR